MTQDQLTIVLLNIRLTLLETMVLRSEIALKAVLQREQLPHPPVDQIPPTLAVLRRALQASQRDLLAGRLEPRATESERAMLADELNEVFERLKLSMEQMFSV